MIGKYRRPSHRRMLSLTVRSVEVLSPHYVSLTLAGDDVDHLERSGYDQNGRVFFPPRGQEATQFPNSKKWMRQLARIASSKRPRVRFYSIRRFHDDAFDIEVVLHHPADGGPASPGAAWAQSAEPGDPVAFIDEGGVYGAQANATWQLLVGDESALPPLLAILEQTASSLPAEAFVEVPTAEDVRDVPTPEGTTIHWLPRDNPTLKPGALALAAVTQAALRDGPFYTWTAGESALATGLRRHLVNDRGVPKSDIAFHGYWKHGRASLG